MKCLLTTTVMLAALLVPASFANNKVTINDIGFAGNGCLAETEPDKQTYVKSGEHSVRLIPQGFSLSSAESKRSFIRKKCDVAVTVDVPEGYQLGISNASAYGFLELEEGAKVKITLSAGSSGKNFAMEEIAFDEVVHQNVALSQDEVQWSACGADTIARLKVSATLRSKKEALSYLRINSFGLSLEYRKCP